MKHIAIPFFLLLSFVFFAGLHKANAQPCCLLDMGIFNSPENSNTLEIRVKPTTNLSNGVFSGGIFVIRYPISYNVTLTLQTPPQPLGYVNAANGTDAGYQYKAYSTEVLTGSLNWSEGQEIVVAVLQVSNTGSGYGVFELTTDSYAASIAAGDPFYQEMAANGQNGGGFGQQNIFYQASTSAPLPVSLLHFNAKLQENNTALLDWRSEAEKNLLAYDVEHSTNGHDFSKIGQVTAKGSPVTQAAYEFTHTDLQAGSNYYRLRMSDRWGKTEYSPVRIVRLEDKSPAFQVLPNPTSGPITLVAHQLEQYKDDLYYQVTDINGKLLLENRLKDEKTGMDFSNYPSGAYYLNVRTNREQLHQFKLVITPK